MTIPKSASSRPRRSVWLSPKYTSILSNRPFKPRGLGPAEDSWESSRGLTGVSAGKRRSARSVFSLSKASTTVMSMIPSEAPAESNKRSLQWTKSLSLGRSGSPPRMRSRDQLADTT
ncbi:hypothetical protein Mapa_011868 [Marchantia paleacea]|nr:hypothetical protein Mapa_011868 [Marchantia paleacea]